MQHYYTTVKWYRSFYSTKFCRDYWMSSKSSRHINVKYTQRIVFAHINKQPNFIFKMLSFKRLLRHFQICFKIRLIMSIQRFHCSSVYFSSVLVTVNGMSCLLLILDLWCTPIFSIHGTFLFACTVSSFLFFPICITSFAEANIQTFPAPKLMPLVDPSICTVVGSIAMTRRNRNNVSNWLKPWNRSNVILCFPLHCIVILRFLYLHDVTTYFLIPGTLSTYTSSPS